MHRFVLFGTARGGDHQHISDEYMFVGEYVHNPDLIEISWKVHGVPSGCVVYKRRSD